MVYIAYSLVGSSWDISMNKAKEMATGRITYILYPPVIFYDMFSTGMEMKKVKASVAPKPWYYTMWPSKVTFQGGILRSLGSWKEQVVMSEWFLENIFEG